jgi:hypothetical protein
MPNACPMGLNEQAAAQKRFDVSPKIGREPLGIFCHEPGFLTRPFKKWLHDPIGPPLFSALISQNRFAAHICFEFQEFPPVRETSSSISRETRTEKPGQTEMTRMNKHLPYLISIVFRFRIISVCPGFSPSVLVSLVSVQPCLGDRLWRRVQST